MLKGTLDIAFLEGGRIIIGNHFDTDGYVEMVLDFNDNISDRKAVYMQEHDVEHIIKHLKKLIE